MMGIAYKKTHSLVGLITDLEKSGFVVSDALKSKAFLISDWEASSRYNDDFSVVKQDIEDALILYQELKNQILDYLDKGIGEYRI